MRLRRNTQAGATLLLFFLVTVGLLGDGCSETPLEPDNNSPKDYRVWLAGGEKQLYTYYPLSQRLDSTTAEWDAAWNLAVSPDGNRLYLTGSDGLIVVDSDSLSFIAELPVATSRSVTVIPDDKYVAVVGNGLSIFRTSDYSLHYSDTIAAINGVFSADGRSLYAVHSYRMDIGYKVWEVVKLSISDTGAVVTTRKTWDHGQARMLIPTPDESLWLSYVALFDHGELHAMELYDVASDSIIFGDSLRPGSTDLIMSPDGTRAYYNNAGMSTLSQADTLIFVLDIPTQQVIEEIALPRRSVESIPFYPHRLAVTPDHRWLLALSSEPDRGFYLYDLQAKQLLDFHVIRQHYASLAVQTNQ